VQDNILLKLLDIVWMEIGQPFTLLNLLSAVIVVVEICSKEAKLGNPLRSWKTSLLLGGPLPPWPT
jgi:hypothetical protein